MTNEIYSINATLYLKSEGELVLLCNELANKLNLPEFYFKTDPDPPYELIGFVECLGFFLQVKEVVFKEMKYYSLILDSELTQIEQFTKRSHDISPWFAKVITTFCKMEVVLSTD